MLTEVQAPKVHAWINKNKPNEKLMKEFKIFGNKITKMNESLRNRAYGNSL